MADTFINLETAGDHVVCANTLPCSHPRHERFDAVVHSFWQDGPLPAHRLCAGCGWDFGPAAALDNLGRIAGELFATTLGAEHSHDPCSLVARRAGAVLARWGITAEWFDAEVDRRLSPKAAYYAAPSARSLVDPWGAAA